LLLQFWACIIYLIKAKLILGKYLVIFTAFGSRFTASCPELPYFRISGETLAETETLAFETLRTYVRKGNELEIRHETALEVDRIWQSVVEPALSEVSRKASVSGWAMDSRSNTKGFNQINRFNRSCSIRMTGTNSSVRKLTIGWRTGSDSFSFGNTLTVFGWKNVKHSSLSLVSLVDDLTERLLA
jgi:predicted RNase H-like HicB family nuclease